MWTLLKHALLFSSIEQTEEVEKSSPGVERVRARFRIFGSGRGFPLNFSSWKASSFFFHSRIFARYFRYFSCQTGEYPAFMIL
jgi:hypothetical protein